MESRNHHLFNEWLLSERPLLPDQACALQEHLATCLACRQLSSAWTEVEVMMRGTPIAQPPAGFTARWHSYRMDREALNQFHRERRFSNWTLLIWIGGAASLLGLLVIFALSLQPPVRLLSDFVYQAIAFLTFARSIQDLLGAIFRTVFSFIPPVLWIVIIAGVGLLNLLWIISLRQMLTPWRISQ